MMRVMSPYFWWELWAPRYDEQNKWKADGPNPGLLKSTQSCCRSKCSSRQNKGSICLYSFLIGKFLVLQTTQRGWRGKLDADWIIDTAWQQPCQFQRVKVHSHSSRRHWPNDPFPFKSLLFAFRRLFWLWCVLMSESNISWNICGLSTVHWMA